MQAAVRRSGGARSLVRARNALVTSTRSYATPVSYHHQEADPQLNGYPQLPNISRQRLPAKGWWDPQMRRNFGDTLHENEELLSVWGPDVAPLPPRTAARWLGIAVATFAAIMGATYAMTPARNAIAKDYPYSGLVTELGGVEENQARVAQSDEETGEE